MQDYKNLYTLTCGIPIEKNRGIMENQIGMDTGIGKEGIHLWIGHHELIKEEQVFISQSVHLNRKEAKMLIDEIKERLF